MTQTLLEPAPPQATAELTHALLVPAREIRRLSAWLLAIDEAGLSDLHLAVVYPRAIATRVQALTAERPRLRLIQAPGASRAALATALIEDLHHFCTPLVSAQFVGRGSRVVDSLVEAIASLPEHPHLDAGENPPVLLHHTSTTPREVAIRYVDRTLRDAEGTPESRRQHLGQLALHAAHPVLEYVDAGADRVRVTIWLNSGTATDVPAPDWTYRVALRDATGAAVTEEVARPSERPGRFGGSSWDHVVVWLSLAQVPDGDHQLTIELEEDPRPRPDRRIVRSRPGVLLCSRPTQLQDGQHTRYLFQHSGSSRRTYVTVQHGSGAWAETRWTTRLALKDLSFVLRRRGNARMRWLRLLRLLTLPLFVGRQVWLVGERFDTAQDNGMHLFRYLSQHPSRRRRVYYVISDDSPQRNLVADCGRVVRHSGWRHQLLMLHADAVIGAYSLHYLIPRHWDAQEFIEQVSWRIGARQVFLQHGVHMNPRGVRRGSTGYDLMVTSTPREAAAISEVSGYAEQLIQTGQPRFDALVPTPSTRTVLFMSTWRQYLVPALFGASTASQQPFEGSTYQAFMTEFLASARLASMLERYDYRLVMLPHYNMNSSFTDMATGSPLITIADPDASIQRQLLECDGFITDYSSVHFDVAYLGTPLIYSRFDEVEYEARHAAPGWFDYDREGFGPVARTLEETLDALEQMLARGCTQPPFYAERVVAEFAHQDRRNSERVTAAIADHLSSRPTHRLSP